MSSYHQPLNLGFVHICCKFREVLNFLHLLLLWLTGKTENVMVTAPEGTEGWLILQHLPRVGYLGWVRHTSAVQRCSLSRAVRMPSHNLCSLAPSRSRWWLCIPAYAVRAFSSFPSIFFWSSHCLSLCVVFHLSKTLHKVVKVHLLSLKLFPIFE